MGVTTVDAWTGGLIAAGLAADTPAVCVLRASLPDQQTLQSTLGKMAALVLRVRGCARRPCSLSAAWRDWGCAGLVQPAAALGSDRAGNPAGAAGRSRLRSARRSIERAGSTGDRAAGDRNWPAGGLAAGRRGAGRFGAIRLAGFFQRQWRRRVLLAAAGQRSRSRALAALRLAAIGPATAEALARFHLHADLVPDAYRAEALAAALAEQAAGRRLLLVRASRGRQVLAEEFAAPAARWTRSWPIAAAT